MQDTALQLVALGIVSPVWRQQNTGSNALYCRRSV